MGAIRVSLICLALLLTGCELLHNSKTPNYQTIAENPNQDTDKARKENTRALDLIDKCKYDQAESALQNALIADVNYGPAHNNLGRVYYHQGKLYLAAWEFQYALKLMGDRPEPHCNLGLIYEKVGRLEQAIQYYQAAYSLAPDNPEYIGNLVRARIYNGEKNPEVAELLADLLLYETRSDWVCWAKNQQAISGYPHGMQKGLSPPTPPPPNRELNDEDDPIPLQAEPENSVPPASPPNPPTPGLPTSLVPPLSIGLPKPIRDDAAEKK